MKIKQQPIVTLFYKPGQHVKVVRMGAPAWVGEVVNECAGRPGWYYVRGYKIKSWWTDLVYYGDMMIESD